MDEEENTGEWPFLCLNRVEFLLNSNSTHKSIGFNRKIRTNYNEPDFIESLLDLPQHWVVIQQSRHCCSEKMLRLQLVEGEWSQWKELV